MKTLFFFFFAILSQVALASEWTQIQLNKNGYHLRVSYTKTHLPATYGSSGGVVSGRAYLDLYTSYPSVAEKAEIFLLSNSNRSLKQMVVKMNEDNARHFWGQVADGPSYAEHFYIGATYLIRLTVDGRLVDFTFKAI